MGTHYGLYDFMDRVQERYGLELQVSNTLGDFGIDKDGFIDFLFETFSFKDSSAGLIYNTISYDMTFLDIYNHIFM
jgi:hypothetical protein